MICWKVSHKHKLIDHIERKDIGIYSSLENAEKAVASAIKDEAVKSNSILGNKLI